MIGRLALPLLCEGAPVEEAAAAAGMTPASLRHRLSERGISIRSLRPKPRQKPGPKKPIRLDPAVAQRRQQAMSDGFQAKLADPAWRAAFGAKISAGKRDRSGVPWATILTVAIPVLERGGTIREAAAAIPMDKSSLWHRLRDHDIQLADFPAYAGGQKPRRTRAQMAADADATT